MWTCFGTIWTSFKFALTGEPPLHLWWEGLQTEKRRPYRPERHMCHSTPGDVPLGQGVEKHDDEEQDRDLQIHEVYG